MAQTSYLGGIFMMATDYPPKRHVICSGQLLAIAQNTALFSLLGNFYGGDGLRTFQLPNLQGRSPMQQGTNQQNMTYTLGASGGTERVTLLLNNLPTHDHQKTLVAAMPGGATASTANAISSFPAALSGTNLYSPTPGTGTMAPLGTDLPANTGITGGNNPHNNMQPYLAITFVIALSGLFPSRPTTI